jgi:hypothetical protein
MEKPFLVSDFASRVDEMFRESPASESKTEA